jgi:hypothetical protein
MSVFCLTGGNVEELGDGSARGIIENISKCACRGSLLDWYR